MRIFYRTAVKDVVVEAQNGDRQEIRKGQTYITSHVHDDDTVTVFSSFWVRFPVDVFDAPTNEKR